MAEKTREEAQPNLCKRLLVALRGGRGGRFSGQLRDWKRGGGVPLLIPSLSPNGSN